MYVTFDWPCKDKHYDVDKHDVKDGHEEGGEDSGVVWDVRGRVGQHAVRLAAGAAGDVDAVLRVKIFEWTFFFAPTALKINLRK